MHSIPTTSLRHAIHISGLYLISQSRNSALRCRSFATARTAMIGLKWLAMASQMACNGLPIAKPIRCLWLLACRVSAQSELRNAPFFPAVALFTANSIFDLDYTFLANTCYSIDRLLLLPFWKTNLREPCAAERYEKKRFIRTKAKEVSESGRSIPLQNAPIWAE